LEGNDNTYGIKFEVIAGYVFRDSGCYFILVDGGFVEELDEHKTIYTFCCKYPESMYGAS